MSRRIVGFLILVAAAAIGGLAGWLLEPAVNAWLFTRKGAGQPWDEPGGGW